MSNNSHSNQQPSDEGTKNSVGDLSEDLNTQHIDDQKNDPPSNSDELATLEKMLEEEINDHQSNTSSQNIDINTSTSSAEMDNPIASSDPSLKPQKVKFNKQPIEKIATIACYLAMLGIFTYLIIYVSGQHDFDTSKPYEANTPAKGDYADIETIETWWSKPVGDNTKYGVMLVPSATITLGPNSKSGVLRSIFYSYEEGLRGQLKPKGDPFSHEFVDGKFKSTGTNQVTIHCTDGFRELAHFLFYRSQDEKRWIIEINEAADIQTEVDGFNSLANAPIEPIRK